MACEPWAQRAGRTSAGHSAGMDSSLHPDRLGPIGAPPAADSSVRPVILGIAGMTPALAEVSQNAVDPAKWRRSRRAVRDLEKYNPCLISELPATRRKTLGGEVDHGAWTGTSVAPFRIGLRHGPQVWPGLFDICIVYFRLAKTLLRLSHQSGNPSCMREQSHSSRRPAEVAEFSPREGTKPPGNGARFRTPQFGIEPLARQGSAILSP